MAFFGRRKHQRFPCDLPARIYRAGTIDGAASCRIISLGLGGASIETGTRLDTEAEYDLRVALNGRRRRLRASVVWQDGAAFGLSFHPSPRQDAFLKAVLDGLRASGPEMHPSLESTIKNYWSL